MQIRRTGAGPPVLFVHGSMLGGRYQWIEQSELRNRWEMLLADRTGYRTDDGEDVGENWAVDADDIVAELERHDGGAHLVGFSYGAVGSILAANRVPHAVRSLALIEPSTWSVAFDVPEVKETYDSLVNAVIEFWGDPAAMAQAFLDRVGATQKVRQDRLPRALQVGVRAVAQGRPSGEAEIPLDELRARTFPKLVVSGEHSVAFETICDRVADGIGARRAHLAGAGHGVPALGEPLNAMLEALWTSAEPAESSPGGSDSVARTR
ncbi:MAG: alpha/beta fold hydrolase [Solirubrobacteraceae bacterium]|nr:alpha/beta fold hydrolase [Solirubrobacteraceae bacterium]